MSEQRILYLPDGPGWHEVVNLYGPSQTEVRTITLFPAASLPSQFTVIRKIGSTYLTNPFTGTVDEKVSIVRPSKLGWITRNPPEALEDKVSLVVKEILAKIEESTKLLEQDGSSWEPSIGFVGFCSFKGNNDGHAYYATMFAKRFFKGEVMSEGCA